MPTLAIIGIFVEKTGLKDSDRWVTFEFIDHTRSKAQWLTSKYFLTLSDELDYTEWMKLQEALKNPGQWVTIPE